MTSSRTFIRMPPSIKLRTNVIPGFMTGSSTHAHEDLESRRMIGSPILRPGQLEVAFWLSWSPAYLESIAEALSAINQRSDCGGLFGCRGVASQIDVTRAGFGPTTQAWFNDTVAEQMVKTELVNSNPVIRISILDTSGIEQYKGCLFAKELDHRDHSALHFVKLKNNVIINGGAAKRYNTYVDLSRLSVTNLDQIRVEIVRGWVTARGVDC